jgi:hypothetical protein
VVYSLRPPSQDTSQICDGEPEGGREYYGRLDGESGPLVTSYWSVQSDAFIIPEPGGLPTVYLNLVWNGVGTSSPSWAGTFDMTIDGQSNETITIQSSPDKANYIEVWQSSISTSEPVFTGYWSDLSGRSITIIPGSNDTIDIRNVPDNVSVLVDGGRETDTINVSPGTDQTTILGNISVRNEGEASATININDRADSAAVGRTVTFSAMPYVMVDQITFSGLGMISYDYGTSFKPVINITGSQFGNTYDVENADVQLPTINSHGSDSVTLGNSTDGVREITGGVILTNGSAATNLTVDDSADPNMTPYTVTLGIDLSDNGVIYGTVGGLTPNNSLVEYAIGTVKSLTVRTPATINTVNDYPTFATTYLISGGNLSPQVGGDTVNVGPGGGLGLINDDLYIENPVGADIVNVNDSKDTTIGRQVTLSDFTPPSPPPPPLAGASTFGRISGLTASGATINYQYVGTVSVTIQLGGGDKVNALSTGISTNLIGTAASDGTATTVNVGDGGSLAGIIGTLNIENPPAVTDINVDDSADTSAPTFTLSTVGPNLTDFASSFPGDSRNDTWGQLSGIPNGANINYEYNDTSSLTLKSGPGATIDVLATGSGFATTLTGNGQTTVDVGDQNNVQGLQGDLFIGNQVPGQTSVYVNDSADTTSLQNVTLGTYQDPLSGVPYESISNLALNAAIYMEAVGVFSVTIYGGTPSSGGNTYYVQGTVPLPDGTILDGGQGPDAFFVASSTNTLDPIQGALSIYGNNPNTSLSVNDSGTTVSENYSVSPTNIERSIIAGRVYDYNTAPINYYQVGKIAVYVGSAQTGLNQGAVSNTLDVFSDRAGHRDRSVRQQQRRPNAVCGSTLRVRPSAGLRWGQLQCQQPAPWRRSFPRKQPRPRHPRLFRFFRPGRAVLYDDCRPDRR